MNDLERFPIALERFLNSNSFYTLEKFFNCIIDNHTCFVFVFYI